MRKFLLVPLVLFAASAFAGTTTGGITTGGTIVLGPGTTPGTTRVPEPEVLALIGVAAAAFGASRWLRRRKDKTPK